MSDAIAQLQAFCTRHDLPWDDDKASKFEGFLALLQQFNKAMNLIGPMDDMRVVETLFIDSVAAAAAARPTGSILDVGSGAGLPGVPLAILFPDSDVTLVEPRQKRTQFLTIATNRLKLKNIDVVRARIEDVEPARYDYVISKAFQPPADWVETASNWVSDTGYIVCLHSAADTDALVARAGELGLHEQECVEDVTELGVAATNVKRSIRVFSAA